MKRSPIQRKTPMKRSSFARSPFQNPANRQTAEYRAEKKRRTKRRKSGEDKRMRDACREEPCYLRIPGICTSNPKHSAPAHRNEGKGMALKTPDVFTVPACPTCHHEYDQGKRFERDYKRAMWNAAYERWQVARAEKMGLEINDALSDSHTKGNALADVSRQEGQELRSGELPADVDVGDERPARRAA